MSLKLSARNFLAIVFAGFLGAILVACGGGGNPTEPNATGGQSNTGLLPATTGIVPDTGPSSGGIVVTISGGGLSTTQSVTIAGIPAQIVVRGTGFVVVILGAFPGIVPASGITGDVVVKTQFGTARITGGFTYLPAPSAVPNVTTISPNQGDAAGGYEVILGGSNLGAVTSVSFGGVPAVITEITPTQIRVIVGAFTGASTTAVDVVTRNSFGASTLVGAFTYIVNGASPDLPHATAILPNQGPPAGDTTVTIAGTKFTDTTAITIAGVSCTGILVVSDAVLTCRTGAFTGSIPLTGDVRVTTLIGADLGPFPQFTYTSLPTGPTPDVISFAPNQGPRAGGTFVTFTGTGLDTVLSVTLAGVPCTPIIPLGTTQLQCQSGVFPGAVPAVGDVSVTNANGATVFPGGWTYTSNPIGQLPVITTVTPACGPISGSTFITISGSNLAGVTNVTIAGQQCSGIQHPTIDTQITCSVTGPGNTLTGDVVATNANGDGILLNGFQFTNGCPQAGAPTVISINPNSGPQGGGTGVTITGTNFRAGTISSVLLAGIPCTGITVLNDTRLTCTTGTFTGPAPAVGDVDASNQFGTGTLTNGWTYTAGGGNLPPTVTAIVPASGPAAGGTGVTISGLGFTGVTNVTLAGVSCTSIIVQSDTQLTCLSGVFVGPVPTTGDVTATNGFGTGTLLAAWTYIGGGGGVPTVLTIIPNNGPAAGGTGVTITGTNFAGVTNVTLAGVNCGTILIQSATQLTCVSGAFTGPVPTTGDVNVTNAAGTGNLPGGYTYNAGGGGVPTVLTISPNTGPAGGGTPVTITGTNFDASVSVALAGIGCANVVVQSSTQLTCISGAFVGPVPVTGDVTVTAAAGTGTLLAGWTYTAAGGNLPTVISVVPNNGPAAGSTSVLITGTNFGGVNSVTLAGVSCGSVVILSPTQLSCISGAYGGSVPATGDVNVTNASGTGTLPAGWTYSASGSCPPAQSPVITSVSPTSGPADGQNPASPGSPLQIRIFGANLTGVNSVTIVGVPASNVTVIGPTEVRCDLNPFFGATPAIGDVIVDGGPCGPATLLNGFTYTGVFKAEAINPDQGPQAGNAQSTISGFGLNAVSTVTICGVPATIVSMSNTSVVILTGPYNQTTPRVCDVFVSNGTSNDTIVGGYTYISDIPTVNSITPDCGHESGGESFTINGSNLSGTTGVLLADTAATSVKDVTDNIVTLVSSAFIGPVPTTGNVIVQTPTAGDFETLVQFTYGMDIPIITDFTPNNGPPSGGNLVTIKGGPFDVPLAGSITVNFGVNSAVVVSLGGSGRTNQILQVLAPAGCGSVPITITTTDGSTCGGGTAITATNYTYNPPLIASIAPASGSESGGTLVTINGSGFLGVSGAAGVTFGGVNAASYTVFSDTLIRAVSPPFAVVSDTTVELRVRQNNACPINFAATNYTYTANAATITSVTVTTPATGAPNGRCQGGETITITGTDLSGATNISLVGVPVAAILTNTNTTITAVTGSYGCANPTPTQGDVIVDVPSGPVTRVGGFNYYGAPTVTGFAPLLGPAATVITVDGTNFFPAAPAGSVTAIIVGCNAAPVTATVVSNSRLTFPAPVNTGGGGCNGIIRISNPAGTGDSGGVYTYP